MMISRVQLNRIIREETHRLLEVYSKKQRGAMCAWANSPASENPKGLSNKEAEEQCHGPMKEAEDDSPWTDDEKQERHISHAAEKEARQLLAQFRKSLKKDVGRVWGDDAIERREEEAIAAAIESVVPQLEAALELPAGEERDDKVNMWFMSLIICNRVSTSPANKNWRAFLVILPKPVRRRTGV